MEKGEADEVMKGIKKKKKMKQLVIFKTDLFPDY